MRKFLYHFLLFAFSLILFVIALGLMKEGARPLAPIFRDKFSVDTPASALGMGWLAASLMLSGSPVAATSLSLLDAKVLNEYEAFAMISGSRLGAAFIVLALGLIYILRKKHRDISLGVGLTSLVVTQTIYPVVLGIGFLFLKMFGPIENSINPGSGYNSVLDVVVLPIIQMMGKNFPDWVMFPAGLLLIIPSLAMFDRAIPDLNLNKTDLGMVNHLLYRPIVTFFLGLVITSMTMSVSVSLSLLVPLSVRGFIRRENLIPYILGSNITTFVDTLAAAALLNNFSALRIVFIQIISVTVVSIIILLIGYRYYVRTIEYLVSLINKSNYSILVYIILILVIPFLLIIVF